VGSGEARDNTLEDDKITLLASFSGPMKHHSLLAGSPQPPFGMNIASPGLIAMRTEDKE
jgi:hypothetical protein